MTASIKSCFSLLLLATVLPLGAQSPVTPQKTTDVLVTLTVKANIDRQQVTKVLPEEVRATVRLYLAGKIRQWYSRSDGKGVVFIMDCKDVSEAQSLMEQLPLFTEKLVDYEYMPLSPLAPLSALLGPSAATPVAK
jgi:muconolactone delta-isomerase